MKSEFAASLTALEGELKRFDALAASAGAETDAALRRARRHIEDAIEALAGAARAIETDSPPKPSLLDRIVVIEAASGGEAFRTKVKLKTPEPAAPPPDAATSFGDDLTRIRGIDRALVARLADLGVTSFAQIADWAHTDVRRISEALGLGRQINRQSWIDQAVLLRRPDAVAALPKPVPPVPAPPPEAVVEPENTPVAAALKPPLATAAFEIETPSPAQPPAEPIPAAPLPAPPSEPEAPVAVAAEVDGRTVEPVATSQAAPVAEPPPDRLNLIRGIDDRLADALSNHGIRRYADIAGWRQPDVAHVPQVLGLAAPISKQGWIEQAALLASGRLSEHALRALRGDYAAVVAMPAAEPLPPPVFVPWRPPVALTAPPSPQPLPAQLPEPVLEAEPEPAATVIQVLVDLPAAAAPPLDEPAAATTEVPAAPAAAIDQLSALAEELAAQVANDTSDTADTTAMLPARAARPPGPSRPSALHIEDEEFPELQVDEADVVIVRSTAPAPAAAAERSQADAASRNLLARLKRSSPLDDIDRQSYAAYRDQVEEASVEIIKPGMVRQPPDAADHQPAPTGHRSIKRLLRSLTRST
jgi:predicted flap endonuclease-1-like 5' DNA nuclease